MRDNRQTKIVIGHHEQNRGNLKIKTEWLTSQESPVNPTGHAHFSTVGIVISLVDAALTDSNTTSRKLQ